MKVIVGFLLFAVLCIIVTATEQQKQAKTIQFCGRVVSNVHLCAGRKVPQGTPPYAGKRLYIKAGKSNHADLPLIGTVTADSNGLFSADVPRNIAHFCVVDEDTIKEEEKFSGQLTSKTGLLWSRKCLQKRHSRCLLVVSTKDLIKSYKAQQFPLNNPTFKPVCQFDPIVWKIDPKDPYSVTATKESSISVASSLLESEQYSRVHRKPRHIRAVQDNKMGTLVALPNTDDIEVPDVAGTMDEEYGLYTVVADEPSNVDHVYSEDDEDDEDEYFVRVVRESPAALAVDCAVHQTLLYTPANMIRPKNNDLRNVAWKYAKKGCSTWAQSRKSKTHVFTHDQPALNLNVYNIIVNVHCEDAYPCSKRADADN